MRRAKGVTPQQAGVPLDGYTSSGTITSDPVWLKHIKGWSLTVSCPVTGAPSGTLSVQGCNDMERVDGVFDGNLVNWFTLGFIDTGTGSLVTSKALTNASTITIDDTDSMYRWMRVLYTVTSGSITITCKMTIKSVE